MRTIGVRTRADGSTHVRPAGAVLLSLAVWLLCAALLLQAVALSGAAALLLAPGPLLVCAVIWALLWEPRVVVREDSLEVRNVLRRHEIPFAAVADIRLGAMLRIVLRQVRPARREDDRPTVITAWNAPGAGRDRHRDRLVRIGQSDRAPGAPRPRADWGQRLRADQRTSASSVVVDAWERWRAGEQTGPADEQHSSCDRVNAGVLVVLAVCVVLVGLRIAF